MMKIDEGDEDFLKIYNFFLHKGYYRARFNKKWIHLNRLIASKHYDKPIDFNKNQIKHLNGDTEDCRRANLFIFQKNERQQRFLGKKEIFVSKEDEDLLDVRWSRDKSSRNNINSLWYAKRVETKDGEKKKLIMHRIIMERVIGRKLTSQEKVDHIDFNGLNNRRDNLRIASHQQNCTNRRLNKNNRSGYRGVHCASNGRWKASVGTYYIGTYSTEKDAAIAYEAVARFLYGEFFKSKIEH